MLVQEHDKNKNGLIDEGEFQALANELVQQKAQQFGKVVKDDKGMYVIVWCF